MLASETRASASSSTGTRMTGRTITAARTAQDENATRTRRPASPVLK